MGRLYELRFYIQQSMRGGVWGGEGVKKGDERYLGCDAALFGPLLIAIAHCPPLSILPPSTCCKEGQPYQGFYRCNKINGNNNSVLSFLYILDNYVMPFFNGSPKFTLMDLKNFWGKSVMPFRLKALKTYVGRPINSYKYIIGRYLYNRRVNNCLFV